MGIKMPCNYEDILGGHKCGKSHGLALLRKLKKLTPYVMGMVKGNI